MRRVSLRLVALWVVLLAAYAGTLGIRASARSGYGEEAAHDLLAAKSLIADGDLDVANQYRSRAYARFHPGPLRPDGRRTAAGLHEPHGAGFVALIAPAYAVGGARAVQWLLAAIAALAFVLAAALARRLVPEPWATGGVALVGLSPPALAASTSITPAMTGGAALAGAALCALSARTRPRAAPVCGGALLLAALPWLDLALLVPGVAVAAALVAWTHRQRRRVLAIVAAELIVASLVFFATLSERLYGGLTTRAAHAGADPSFPLGYLDRLPNLIGVWLDRWDGILRWAPVLVLPFYAGWLLYRSRRQHLARLAPERRDAEACAGLLLAIGAGQLLVATFWWSGLRGPWFPGAHLAAALPAAGALAAWALRHVPRWLGALLGALTLAASAWLVVALRTGAVDGWLGARARGPLAGAFPDFDTQPLWAAAVTVAIAAALGVLAAREWRDRRALRAPAGRVWSR